MWQLLTNLFKNAQEAMAGRADRRISVSTANERINSLDLDEMPYDEKYFSPRPGRFLRLTIEDTGPGIPEPIMARLFDAYVTSKGEKKSEPPVTSKRHRGLGLSSVQKIVSARGGFIVVSNLPVQGARFDVYLPARAPSHLD